MKLYSYILILSLLFLGACQEDGDELTLTDLQQNEIRQANQFNFRAKVDVSDFNTNFISFVDADTVFLIKAVKGQEEITLSIPFLGVGAFSGSTNPNVNISFLDEDRRFYSSENFRLASNAEIIITNVDTTLSTFDGVFSGTLYDVSSSNPEAKQNQVSIKSGELLRIKY